MRMRPRWCAREPSGKHARPLALRACVVAWATRGGSSLRAPVVAPAQIPHLRDRMADLETFASPIGRAEGSDMHFVPHDDFFVDEETFVSSQVVVGLAPAEADETCFHRAGPRRRVAFGPGEARAAVVTCGGVCPGLNTVVRELYRCLSRQYGVSRVMGVRDGYAGFSDLAEGAVELDDAYVDDIHKRGGTVLRTSRGGHSTSTICDALEHHGVNVLFLVGGDGTMKGACKVDEEMARRGRKCVVAVVPKTIDNDVPVIDKSFGFGSAVEAAIPHLAAAHTEAEACPNGVGIVKLMGRHSGFIAMHATLASGDVDLCLVPESDFELEAVLEHVERKLRRNQNALIVVAEGAGQKQMGAAGARDASGNVLNEDVGPWLKQQVNDYFARARFDDDADFATHRPKTFYVDPTYTIRACPANAADQVYCSSLAHAAVHGAMAGYTRFLVGNVNTRLALLPLDLVVNRRNIVSVRDRMWTRLLFTTSQPPFEAAEGHAGPEECDPYQLYRAETASGGCTVVLPGDDDY